MVSIPGGVGRVDITDLSDHYQDCPLDMYTVKGQDGSVKWVLPWAPCVETLGSIGLLVVGGGGGGQDGSVKWGGGGGGGGGGGDKVCSVWLCH